MINSFLNLCRTCPMPTNDKFTEYKTNYKWYENYSAPTGDQSSTSAFNKKTDLIVKNEPAIHRRKKYPDLAYRSNHIVYHVDPAIAADRARSKEKAMANSRSRSADPNMGRKSLVVNPISEYIVPYQRTKDHREYDPLMTQSFPPPAPSSSSHRRSYNTYTEYRSQYTWPARKSASLNVIKGGESKAGVITRQPSTARAGKATEYKERFRPFSSYDYVDGNWKEQGYHSVVLSQPVNDATSWYQEVVDNRKKAEENRTRSRYSTLESDNFAELYKRQVALWSQVGSRYTLSALSLESSQPNTPKKQKSKGRRPNTSMSNLPPRRSSQSPQKSPQKKSFDSPDAHSSDTTSPVKLEGSSRPKSPKKAFYAKPSATDSRSVQPKNVSTSKPKKNDDKKLNENKNSKRPTTLAGPPRSKASRTSDNIPKAHSKPKKQSTNAPTRSTPEASAGKIWLKPEKKSSPAACDDDKNACPTSQNEDAEKSADVNQPAEAKPTCPIIDDSCVFNGASSPHIDSPPPLPEPGIVPVGPVHLTHVRSPEEVTGVKSPDPETWIVPLHKSQPLQWTDGQIESPMSDSGRTTSTPASQNSPHHIAQKTKPAAIESLHQSPKKQTILEENATTPEPPVHIPNKSGQNISPKPPPGNPEEILDKARSKLDEFWNNTD